MRKTNLVLISFLLAFTLAGNTACSEKPTKFRFEDYADRVPEKYRDRYKTTKEGLEDLKKLYPFGSELGPLLKTLTEAGATCFPTSDRGRAGTYRVLCSCTKGAGGIWGWLGIVVQGWTVVIQYDRDDVPLDTEPKGRGRVVKLDSPANQKRKIILYKFGWGMSGP